MRQQWVLATRGRLANIAQYHMERVQRSQRGLFWYGFRIFFSLLFAIIAFLSSRWLGRLTRKVALPAVESLGKLKVGSLNLGQQVAGRLSARSHRNIVVTIYFLGVLSIWVSTALLCLSLVWSIPIDLDNLALWIQHPLVVIGNTPVSLWMLVRLILWLAVSVWFAGWVQRFSSDHFLQYFDMDRGVRDTLGVIFRYLVLIVGIILALTSVGIASDQLTVVFGLLSIGIGFGLRDIVNNYLSGLFLLFTRPIRKGDYVESAGLFGVVQEIRAGSTTIRTRDAVSVIVPNSEFINHRVVNWTHGDNEAVRAQVAVSVDYQSDIRIVQDVLLEIAKNENSVMPNPAPHVEVRSLQESAIEIILHVWTKDIFNMPRVKSDLYSSILTRFREEGIKIPYPRRQVQINQASPETED
jgi:small-conductance mechanosensitive channel